MRRARLTSRAHGGSGWLARVTWEGSARRFGLSPGRERQRGCPPRWGKVAAHCSSIDPLRRQVALFSPRASERENGKAYQAGCYYSRLETRLERVMQLSSHTGTLSSSAPPRTCLILPLPLPSSSYISSRPALAGARRRPKRAAGLWKGRSILGNQRRRTGQGEKHTRDRAAEFA
jgi:hypothetical protein